MDDEKDGTDRDYEDMLKVARATVKAGYKSFKGTPECMAELYGAEELALIDAFEHVGYRYSGGVWTKGKK